MTLDRTATAAAVAGLVAVAAWSLLLGPRGPERVAARSAGVASGAGLEWQLSATGEDRVPASVLRAASGITIAVIDTGADASAPDIADKHPVTYDARSRTSDVADTNGHGTFVAALAAGSVTGAGGITGFGGDARLLVVKASGSDGTVTATAEAAAIRFAVDRGANVINLSLAGTTTSPLERSAIRYAADRGVLIVAAAGNDYRRGNPVEYPAALLQPVGSNGRGGIGLTVAASTRSGGHASFSNTGSWVSLAAPGEGVFGALSTLSSPNGWPRAQLAGVTGLYGYASGTSFAAPQVAGAAALVWAANRSLTAKQVAQILKDTASGQGVWSPDLGFGVIDVAGAVARAQSLLVS